LESGCLQRSGPGVAPKQISQRELKSLKVPPLEAPQKVEWRIDEDGKTYSKDEFKEFYKEEFLERWRAARILPRFRIGQEIEYRTQGMWIPSEVVGYRVSKRRKQDFTQPHVRTAFGSSVPASEWRLMQHKTPERRLDNDGKPYTKKQFLTFYGGAYGLQKWQDSKIFPFKDFELGEKCLAKRDGAWNVVTVVGFDVKRNREGEVFPDPVVLLNGEEFKGFPLKHIENESEIPGDKRTMFKVKRYTPELVRKAIAAKIADHLARLNEDEGVHHEDEKTSNVRKRKIKRKRVKKDNYLYVDRRGHGRHETFKDFLIKCYLEPYFAARQNEKTFDTRRLGPPIRWAQPSSGITDAKKQAMKSYSNKEYNLMASDENRRRIYKESLRHYLKKVRRSKQMGELVRVVDIGTGAKAFWFEVVLEIMKEEGWNVDELYLYGIEINMNAARNAANVLRMRQERGENFNFEIVNRYSLELLPKSTATVQAKIENMSMHDMTNTIPKYIDIVVQEILGDIGGAEGS